MMPNGLCILRFPQKLFRPERHAIRTSELPRTTGNLSPNFGLQKCEPCTLKFSSSNSQQNVHFEVSPLTGKVSLVSLLVWLVFGLNLDKFKYFPSF